MGHGEDGRGSEVWTRFWSSKGELDDVYGSSPRFVGTLLEQLPEGGARVLEIGAGTGRDAAALDARGHHAVALDASSGALDLLGREHPSLRGRGIVGGDAMHLPFGDATFDAVFHQGVLEHFGNPSAFLAENLRVTVPGGILVVDVPQTWHPWTALKRIAIRVDRWFAGWEADFTIGGLERSVRNAGYETVGSYGDTMVPSLGYRLVREAARRCGASLPLEPRGPAPLRRLRRSLRRRLHAPRGMRHMAHTIGVVARRPGVR